MPRYKSTFRKNGRKYNDYCSTKELVLLFMQTRFLLWKIYGKIVVKGTHRELMKNCEVYQQIAKSQMSEKN